MIDDEDQKKEYELEYISPIEDEDSLVWNAVARDEEDDEEEEDFESESETSGDLVNSKPKKKSFFSKSMPSFASNIEFGGKNMEGGAFSRENLENANFSASSLVGVDFSGANLRNVDFSGANLEHANLTGADLTGAILVGANLRDTNFTGAILKSVKLHDADIQDAILIDIEIDDIALEELQELIEYLAKNYPHKLNLSRMNLTLLDLTKIDLTRVSLRGVDFTGVDFTGVNIMELDLSECIITPQQIAQAMGHMPSPEELRKILAPKEKNDGKGFKGIDFEKLFFDDGRDFGTWDFSKDKGVSIEKMLKVGKKLFRSTNSRPEVKDAEVIEKIRSNHENMDKNNNKELRELIEERKRAELEARKEKKRSLEKTDEDHVKSVRDSERIGDSIINQRGSHER